MSENIKAFRLNPKLKNVLTNFLWEFARVANEEVKEEGAADGYARAFAGEYILRDRWSDESAKQALDLVFTAAERILTATKVHGHTVRSPFLLEVHVDPCNDCAQVVVTTGMFPGGVEVEARSPQTAQTAPYENTEKAMASMIADSAKIVLEEEEYPYMILFSCRSDTSEGGLTDVRKMAKTFLEDGLMGKAVIVNKWPEVTQEKDEGKSNPWLTTVTCSLKIR